MINIKTITRDTADADTWRRIFKTAQHGIFDGLHEDDSYLASCRWWLERLECIVIFTRDEGYHTSGWWKNPDYERCYHLSVSFPGGMKPKYVEHILKGLFGDHRRWTWCEGPFSDDGKRLGVYHYRLFCNPAWEPLKPRGEVYSRELTEAGWKSYSEQHRI